MCVSPDVLGVRRKKVKVKILELRKNELAQHQNLRIVRSSPFILIFLSRTICVLSFGAKIVGVSVTIATKQALKSRGLNLANSGVRRWP